MYTLCFLLSFSIFCKFKYNNHTPHPQNSQFPPLLHDVILKYMILSLIDIYKQIMHNRVFSRNDNSREKYRSSLPIDTHPYRIQDRYIVTEDTHHVPTGESLYQRHSQSLKRENERSVPKRKVSQVSTLHQQYQMLKDQMKALPDGEEGQKVKERQRYAQDEAKEGISESSGDYKAFSKNVKHNKRQSPLKHNAGRNYQFFEDESLQKRDPNRYSGFSSVDNESKRQKQSSESSKNIFPSNKSPNLSSPPLQLNKQRSIQTPQKMDSPIKRQLGNILTPTKPINNDSLPNLISERSLNVKTKLERFSSYINMTMEKILEKIIEVERKEISLDLCLEELRQVISQRTMSQSQSEQISQAKSRQYKFLIGQYQSKVKQVKAENQRLQKQVLNIRLKEEYSRAQCQEYEYKLKEFQRLEETYEKLRKAKAEADRKIGEAESKINRIEREKKVMESELQTLKIKQSSERVLKEEQRPSNLMSSRGMISLKQDIDQLKQQILALQTTNRQHEKTIASTNNQINVLTRSNTQNKMMLDKMKELNEELQKEREKLQRDSVQKEIQATEKLCNLNNNVKKKLKQYDNFKNLIVECLEQIYKKVPKKIKKNFQAQLINKNRTDKCQILFRCLNQFMAFFEDQQKCINDNFSRDFSLSPIQIQKIGLENCLKKIKNDMNLSSKSIENLKAQVKSLQSQNQRLSAQTRQRTSQLASVRSRIEPQFTQLSMKKIRSQSIKKETGFVQVQVSKGGSQQLTKKKAQVDKLNKEVNRLIEESHSKYLQYEDKIINLEMREKQLNANLAEIKSEKQDIALRLMEKEQQLKNNEKVIANLKLEKDALNMKIVQSNNETIKLNIQNQSKLNKLSAQNEAFKKKIKKIKTQAQINDKTLNTKLSIKEKTINDLLQQKKKLTVQAKILSQKVQFAKIMEEAKEPSKKVELPSVSIQEERILREQIENLKDQLEQKQAEIRSLINSFQNLKVSFADQERQLQKAQQQIRKKQDQIDKNALQNKQRQARKQHIIDQYKKTFDELKQSKEQLEKKLDQQRQKKMKELNKVARQLETKDEEIAALIKMKNDESNKVKDLEQTLSQKLRENEELIKVVHRKQEENQMKQEVIDTDKEKIQQLKDKIALLEKQMLQRQQCFKKGELIIEELMKENSTNKKELAHKEDEIMQLIKERNDLNFRLRQDLDAKSQNIKIVHFNYENQVAVLKERLEMTENQLNKLKEQVKMKNELIDEMKGDSMTGRMENQELKQVYEMKLITYNEEIQNLKNKLDILEEQISQRQMRENEMNEQMRSQRKRNIEYMRENEEKDIEIMQLKEALQILKEEVINSAEIADEINEKYMDLRNKAEQQQKYQEKYKKKVQEYKEIEKAKMKKQGQIDNLQAQMKQKSIEIQIKSKQNQDLNQQLQIKQTQLLGMIKKYQSLKVQVSQQMDAKSQYMKGLITNKQENEQRLKETIEILQMKTKRLTQQTQTLKSDIRNKDDKITSLSSSNQLLAYTQSTRYRPLQLSIFSLQPMAILSSSQASTSKLHHPQSQLFSIYTDQDQSHPVKSLQNIQSQPIRSEYLTKLKAQIDDILFNKQQSFNPSFYDLHSNSCIQLLNAIRYQLVEYKNTINQDVLEELAFIQRNQFDFCEDIEQQLQESLRILVTHLNQSENHYNLSSQIDSLKSQKDKLNIELLRISHQLKQNEQNNSSQIGKLKSQLNAANQQLKRQENQINEMIQKKQEEMEQQERYFMNQSQILRKEKAKDNARADKNQYNFMAAKRGIQKILGILLSKQDKRDDLEQAFEHIAKICDQKDAKLQQDMDNYLSLYSQQQQHMAKELREKDEKGKKKKGFFGFN